MADGKKRTLEIVSIVIFIAILVFVALLSRLHYLRYDLTKTKEYSLAERSVATIKKLTQEINIIGFVREGMDEYAQLKRIFAAYEYTSHLIKTKLVDPVRYPSIAQKYKVKQFNTVIVEGYNRLQIVKFPTEENITNAINRIIEGKTRKIAWIMGHGERTFKEEKEKNVSILKEILEGENFELEEKNLLRDAIDRSYDIVIIAGPENNFLSEEIQSLKGYLNQGGNLVVFLEPFSDAGLVNLLKGYGIVAGNDIVVDPFSKAQGGDFLLPIVVQYANHEITKDFNLATIYRSARSISIDKDMLKDYQLTELAYTSPESWAETNLEAVFKGTVQRDNEDKAGPVCLAAISEGNGLTKEEKEQKPKIVVFGDVDFITNQFIGLGGNKQLIRNTINYLGARRDFIFIKKEHKAVEPLLLTNFQKKIVFWVPVVVMPTIVLLLAILVWFRRRAR